MAELTDKEKLNITLKQVFGIQGLNNADPINSGGLRWFEEEYSWQPFVTNEEIFMEDVPVANTPAEAQSLASSDHRIEMIERKLTLVPGAADRAWACFSTYNDEDSPILGDWLLPQMFGRGYAVQLFQASTSDPNVMGDEISTTEGAWIPSYKNGLIILGKDHTASMMNWRTPLFVRAYRYVGFKGVSGASANVGLDDAYNNQTNIDVDNGPVTFNPSNSFAPIQINPVFSSPTQSLDAGQIVNIEGILYMYDTSRSVWKSVYETIVPFGARNASGVYLSMGGFHSDINDGYVALRAGTITGVSASVGSRYDDPSTLDKTFHIKKNQSLVSDYNFTTSNTKFSSTSLDIRFEEGDLVQVYVQPGTMAYSARVNLHISWRA